jgi:hypothetical protein
MGDVAPEDASVLATPLGELAHQRGDQRIHDVVENGWVPSTLAANEALERAAELLS